MNILDIKYCAQDLRFAEEAYKNFETYEKELKDYFLQQPDGYEIFEDLKLRICEMLQSNMKISEGVINNSDVEEIKKSIGFVKQLEEGSEDDDTVEQEPQVVLKDKKLYRSENEKMIGGVCGGLGNYFSIDPLAFRLLFVVIALMSKGIGIVGYAILWIALKPKILPTNLSKRLYRNGADKVIAGVCGGLASFFKTEAWIVRVIFLSPLILNISTGFLDFGFNIFNGSAMGLSIITYIVLWLTTKESETATEELLARGEDITINSISEESEKVNTNPDTNSGLNNILRVVAFIVIGLALISIFFLLIALVFSTIFMAPLTNAILFTPVMKWLGWLSIAFFVLLPLIGFLVWAIRRFNGYKSPNKPLRITFGGLWGLGFASAITLVFLIVSNVQGDATTTERIDLNVQSDTLYVNKLDKDIPNVKVSFGNSMMQNIYVGNRKEQLSQLVSFKQRVSEDNSFYLEVKKSARGSSNKVALQNAQLGMYDYNMFGNQLNLSETIRIPKNKPFRFQSADVYIYVPRGKVLISDPDIIKQKRARNNVKIETDWDDLNKETKEEIEENIEEAMEEVGDAMEEIGDAMEDVGISIEKAGDNIGNIDIKIEKAEKETKAKMRIEEQKLRIKKEQLKLEKLQKELNRKKPEVE